MAKKRARAKSQASKGKDLTRVEDAIPVLTIERLNTAYDAGALLNQVRWQLEQMVGLGNHSQWNEFRA